MWLSSVLFPHPLPPMITKISPRAIVNDRSCWMTNSPYAIVRSTTVMRGGAGATLDAAGLEVQDIEDHREDSVDDDDGHDRRDDGRRSRETHCRGAPTRLHAPKAADEGHDHAEHRALAEADEEARELHGHAGLLEILARPDSQHAPANHTAAHDSKEIRIDRQERHHHDEGKHPGQDEELHRRDAHGGERVDLLVGGHRPELRGERRAGPTCHD